MKKQGSKFLIFLPIIFLIFSCEAWMKSDGFFEKIDEEVFVANAEKINVNIRYANTTQGSTSPNGSATFKVKVTSDISCVTNTAYGFHHWAAFSSEYFNSNAQNGQNKSIIYVSGEDGYDDKILENELDESVVVFGDKYSPSTSVTIQTNRKDIVLVPVVAARPTIDQYSPDPQKPAVRNTSLRYIFTKKMDLDTFNLDSVRITSGYAVLSDQETQTEDVTEKYIWTDGNEYSPTISETGKLIKFVIKPGEELEGNRKITIYLSSEICDIDRYEMESDQKLTFQTGTALDSLAPIITELLGGSGTRFRQFDSIEKANGIKFENFSGISDAYFDSYIEQRVTDNMNIYVFMQDLSGQGSTADMSSSSLEEGDVVFYGIRARLLYDKDGNKVDSELSENNIPILQNSYNKNVNDINVPTSDSTKGFGYAFTYDLSSLPDGLIAIDVWGVDATGNSGLTEDKYNFYDNGYRTLLIVKDTIPPDIEKEKEKIESASEQAIYGWYNSETISSTLIKAKSDINDCGNERLCSSADKIYWIFHIGENPEDWKPDADDPAWQLVSAGNYSLSDISISNEGPVGILMALRDDVGNISDSVKLGDAVRADLTSPEVAGTSWVDEDGNFARSVTGNEDLDQYLKIPFTEILSGVREIKIAVDSQIGIKKGKTKIYYNEISADSEVEYKISERDSNIIELEPPANNAGYTSGIFYITGIKISDTSDGIKLRCSFE